jgi:spoIIIJ-associated protein
MNNIDRIQSIIKNFFLKSGLHDGEIVFKHDDTTNTIWCVIDVNDPRLLTGKNGETLGALNHIVRKMIENSLKEEKEKYPSVVVDINNYQKKRVENLKTIAHMMAERARFFKSSVEVDPMSPFERRIIHEFLSEARDLKTESIGEGLKRRVVIKYVSDTI